MTDEELLQHYIATNDNAAMTELIARYDSQLRVRVDNYGLRGERSTDDVLQEVWKALVAKSHTFQQGRRVGPWLWVMANNYAIMALRRHFRGKDETKPRNRLLNRVPLRHVPAPDPGPDEIYEQKELLSAIRTKLKKLPLRLKEAVKLKFWGGFSNKEAASIIGVSESAFRRRLVAALNFLRNSDEHHDFARCAA